MDSSQVLQSLALGKIDGAENNAATYVSTSHMNVAKYYTFDEYTRMPDILVASKKVMGSLSEDDQKIIKQAALDSQKTQKTEWETNDKAMISKMKENGVKITELDGASKEEFKKTVKPIYDKISDQSKLK